MTTHELARKLLDGPDQPVYVVNEDASLPELVTALVPMKRGEWRHHYTAKPMQKDANGIPFPEQFTVVVGE